MKISVISFTFGFALLALLLGSMSVHQELESTVQKDTKI